MPSTGSYPEPRMNPVLLGTIGMCLTKTPKKDPLFSTVHKGICSLQVATVQLFIGWVIILLSELSDCSKTANFIVPYPLTSILDFSVQKCQFLWTPNSSPLNYYFLYLQQRQNINC